MLLGNEKVGYPMRRLEGQYREPSLSALFAVHRHSPRSSTSKAVSKEGDALQGDGALQGCGALKGVVH